jgi:ABC-type lipoprotein export system ATPase subunit
MLSGLVNLVKTVYMKFTCNKITGILLPQNSGKSTLVKSLQTKDNSILVDFDEIILLNLPADEAKRIEDFKARGEKASANLILYPASKQYLRTMRRQFRFQNIYLFTQDMALLDYLRVKDRIVLAPSNDFWTQIQSRVEDPLDRSLYDSSRTDILLASRNRLIPFSSWEQLRDTICALLKVIPKL